MAEKSKKYVYEWEDYEDGKKNAQTMAEEILADPQLPELEEIIIGCWGESWDNGAQPIIDSIVAHKEKFKGIKSLFVGDMDFEECEVSWIEQADYSALWEALPGLETLTVKGGTNLSLGKIHHPKLKRLEIICGGLPKEVLASIAEAELPELEELALYLGVEDYGFDGGVEDVKNLLEKSDFPKLRSLGIMDSEIQDEVAELVCDSKYMKQIDTLDLSKGTLTDQGGEILLKKLPAYDNVKEVNLEYHYMSEAMMEKLERLSAKVDVSDQQEDDEYDGEIYRYPMLTE